MGSENEAVDGKGLQPAGDIFYAPFWFFWRGRENEPSFEVKLRLGLRRSNVRGEQLVQVDELPATIWPTNLAGMGEKPGPTTNGCCSTGRDESEDTLADEEVPKAHEGRDTAGEEIGKVEIKEGTT